MTSRPVRVSASWLDLREPADAQARSPELVARLLAHDPNRRRWVIHDLGAGSGSMGRWLAPLLPGRQHWVLHDRDTDLLDAALIDTPAADGAEVTFTTRRSDLATMDARQLAGADLITASALLDMLTHAELTAVVDLCMAAGLPALITLSVVGVVTLAPPDALDARMQAAFNAHQRRVAPRGALLGPDAAAYAAQEFTDRGADVVVRTSPWRLGGDHAELAAEWLSGWVGAAGEQEPMLLARAHEYLDMRHDQLVDEQLTVTVNHVDLLVLPR